MRRVRSPYWASAAKGDAAATPRRVTTLRRSIDPKRIWSRQSAEERYIDMARLAKHMQAS